MKKIKNIFFTGAVVTLAALGSCKPYSYFEVDPNNPTPAQTPPALLITGIQTSTVGVYNPFYGQQCGWAQYIASVSTTQGNASFQGYEGGAAGFGWYSALRSVVEMEEGGDRLQNPAFRGLGSFFKAYCIADMSLQMGDVPMSEALKGKSEHLYTPKYDPQREVFTNILSMLDDANTILAKAASEGITFGSPDQVYQGNVAKWQKAVNALRLRTLINLSKKADAEPAMKIKEQFAEIVGNPEKYPIFASIDDDLAWRWYDNEGNRYPRYYVAATFEFYRVGNTYYNLIKQYNDPRIRVVAERTANAAKANPDATAFDVNEYGGVNCNDSYEAIDATKDKASMFNRARYVTATGEPMIILGYAEQCFNIAEAIHRGWLTGNADEYYRKGIEASMRFYGISDKEIGDYLAQSSVAYNGNLEQILNQKYIAFFNNSGWEPFYNMRRTGIPAFQIGDNMTNPSGKVPVRWRYPQEEYKRNEANVNAAIQSQFGGSDGVDDVMWILK